MLQKKIHYVKAEKNSKMTVYSQLLQDYFLVQKLRYHLDRFWQGVEVMHADIRYKYSRKVIHDSFRIIIKFHYVK